MKNKFSFKNTIICFTVVTFFLVLSLWLVRSGNLKAIAKTIALDSAFLNCPFGATETSVYKFLKPEGFISLCVPTMNIAYSKGYYINEGETISAEEAFSYASDKKEEEVLPKEEEKPKAMPILMVNLKPKSNDGYLINGLVYAKNTSSTTVDLVSVMSQSITYKINKATKGPQVLILHTHSTEAFNEGGQNEYTVGISPRSEDDTKNIVAVGNAVSKELIANGVKSIQSTVHNDTDYNNAYSKSLETATQMLKKYPTIKVVLDIHRDSMINEQGEKYRPIIKVGNKNAAQIMFIGGIGTKALPNTHWKENLKTIALVQKQIEETTPGLCRPTLLRDSRYNSQVASGAMLIEIGTCGSTLDEAIYGGQLMAKSLAKVINKLAK